MEDKICSFFGHREIKISKELKEKLFLEIEKLINNGYNVFYFGGFGDFDNLCWETTTELKKVYPQINRIFCLPDSRWLNKLKRPKWLKDENYEDFIYLDLEFNWWYKRIYFRNLEMIKKSSFIVFYVENIENSGSYKALQYARTHKKNYLNLAQSISN